MASLSDLLAPAARRRALATARQALYTAVSRRRGHTRPDLPTARSEGSTGGTTSARRRGCRRVAHTHTSPTTTEDQQILRTRSNQFDRRIRIQSHRAGNRGPAEHCTPTAFLGAVEAGKLLLRVREAGFESLDFSEPAIGTSLGDPVSEVADDLDAAGPLARRDPEHGAPDTAVLVLAGRPIRACAISQRDLASMEVLLEFLPFLFGGFAVFGFRACCASLVEEGSVGADQFVLEDCV